MDFFFERRLLRVLRRSLSRRAALCALFLLHWRCLLRRSFLRSESWRQTWLRRGFRHLHLEVFSNSDVRPLYDFVENLLLLFFLNFSASLIASTSWWRHRIV